MKVLILDTPKVAIARAAQTVAETVRTNPQAVLGLATGGTMLPLYDHLRTLHSEGLSFAGTTSFNLDEYVGLSPDHPCSYHRYMAEALFDYIDIDPSHAHLPKGDSTNAHAEANRYEARIVEAGGIDLQLLGIGINGHIGFNEPTSSLGSRTRVKTLTESTRQANRVYFERDDQVPGFAITMGVATILEAKSCLLIATGAGKAEAVAAMIEGPLSALCPASALQLHPAATIVLDAAAAHCLRLRDYYHHVHPEGKDRVLA